MGFLSEKDLADINTAIRETTDTFMTAEVSLFIKQAKLSLFSSSDAEHQELKIRVLPVAEDTQGGATVSSDRKGKWDFTKGYLQINYDYLKEINLIETDGSCKINHATDYVLTPQGRYDIEGVNLIGWLVGKYMLVKIHIKKRLSDG
jgi:hypothetical protein